MEIVKHILPSDIEKESFRIIKDELEKKAVQIPRDQEPVLMRVIHTTADFDYVESLCFSQDAVSVGIKALKNGAAIVTDTNMALAGINKKALEKLGCNSYCFMADEDVGKKASELGVTRAAVSMQKASILKEKIIFAIGNAPTALIEICNLIEKGFRPELIIGVPVGFVNVVAAKEMIMKTNVPFIVNRGRKGGSNVAAAICNALLYCGGGR